MHYADIYAALVKKGYSVAKVAREAGVSGPMVSMVLHGQRRSYDVASRIAAITGLPLNRMFPDLRYAEPPKKPRCKRRAA